MSVHEPSFDWQVRKVHVIPVWGDQGVLDAAYEQATLGHVAGYRWYWPILARLHVKRLHWAVVEELCDGTFREVDDAEE